MVIKEKMATAQLVLGPPGSGKSTYCAGMRDFLSSIGRAVSVVNLDPANESLPYKEDINITDLVRLEEVMERLKLGPNGGLVYCMEYLETNVDWLVKDMAVKDTSHYYIIDCPGQVELYTHHSSLRNITNRLKEEGMKASGRFIMACCASNALFTFACPPQVVSVHLIDCENCTDPSKFISSLLVSLSCMLQIELPHVNILTKIDLLSKYKELRMYKNSNVNECFMNNNIFFSVFLSSSSLVAFDIDYYTEVMDLSYLLSLLSDESFFSRYKKLNEAIISIVEDHSLVSFLTLSIQVYIMREEIASFVPLNPG